jgi:hypothetical protein
MEETLQVYNLLSASALAATPSFHGFAVTCLVPSVYHQALITLLLPLPVLTVIGAVSKVRLRSTFPGLAMHADT